MAMEHRTVGLGRVVKRKMKSGLVIETTSQDLNTRQQEPSTIISQPETGLDTVPGKPDEVKRCKYTITHK